MDLYVIYQHTDGDVTLAATPGVVTISTPSVRSRLVL